MNNLIIILLYNNVFKGLLLFCKCVSNILLNVYEVNK